ncbi:phosphohydrolase [Rhodococcoides trifolii]|uniref:Phosphohydrolase n=1 Tax=Rhodococcoides trifolii TaxID=908250 RepID=A0A917FZN3_9NOCA|nr:phosphohydrolase [Rhodococcus trifolii]
MYRTASGDVEVLLGHPGGPYFARKDDGSWSVLKGEFTDEDPWDAACREFREEVGSDVPAGPRLDLGSVRQKSGKTVVAFAVEGDLDPATSVSNDFEMEWPRGSGLMKSFPEIDRVEWFALDDARRKMLPAQVAFLDALGNQL